VRSCFFFQNRWSEWITDIRDTGDHTGDPSTFPTSTDLVVGPKFKSRFKPAYPTVQDSPILESAYKDREVWEVDFEIESLGLKIGQYRAVDLYGDG
jgi:hypothetical protein